jgi:hypothetical protein
MVEFVEPFESGSNGANITTANTGFDAVSGTPPVFDTTAYQGSFAAKFSSSSTTITVRRTYSGGLVSTMYHLFYVRQLANPSAAMVVAQQRASGTNRHQVRILATGELQLRNGTTAVAQTTLQLAANTWYRVEWKIVTGTEQRLRVFTGANIEGTTPDEEISGAANQGTGDNTLFGLITAATWTGWIDMVRADPTNWLGPIAFTASASDTAGATDTTTRALTTARPATDTASASDTAHAGITLSRGTADTATADDASARTLATGRIGSDSAPAGDTTTRTTAESRTVADTITGSDTTAAATGHSRPVADSAPAADAIATLVHLLRTPTDTAAATDSVMWGTGTGRTIADTVAATDSASRTTQLARSAAESTTIGDTAAGGLVLATRRPGGRLTPGAVAAAYRTGGTSYRTSAVPSTREVSGT